MAYSPNIKGLTSVDNSTTTLLTSGATFTGTAELNKLSDVMITVATDQNGTLYYEFSADGTNWDTSLSYKYDTGRINPPHVLVKGERYFRARFTNTSETDQTYLRLHTYYGQFEKLTSSINGTLAENFDAIVTRPTDYFSEVAMGKRQGRTLWNKFGYNDDIDIGTEALVSWGGTFTPLSAATTLTISSTDAADDDGGTGVNSLVVYGVDENRDAAIEVVTLSGTSNVVTTSQWLGINRVAMFLCGTGKVNAGTVNVIATSDSSTMAQMPAGGGVTQQCIFHIPRNHTFLVEWLHLNVLNQSQDAELRVKMWVYSTVNNGNQEVFRVDIDTSKTNELDIIPNLPFPISESSVMWLECTTNKNNITLNARFDGILERII